MRKASHDCSFTTHRNTRHVLTVLVHNPQQSTISFNVADSQYTEIPSHYFLPGYNVGCAECMSSIQLLLIWHTYIYTGPKLSTEIISHYSSSSLIHFAGCTLSLTHSIIGYSSVQQRLFTKAASPTGLAFLMSSWSLLWAHAAGLSTSPGRYRDDNSLASPSAGTTTTQLVAPASAGRHSSIKVKDVVVVAFQFSSPSRSRSKDEVKRR